MFEKILVATDFSESSRSAWFAAISIAVRCLAKIEILHVVTFTEYVFDPSHYGVPDENWEQRLKEEMDVQYSPRLYPNSRRNIVFSASIPEAILEFADKEACSMIIMGTHGRKALGRMLMGSVAQEVIRNSKVQVMVVKAIHHPEEHVQNFARILVPIDFSPMSIKALDWAVRFANFLRADLHLIHVADLASFSDLSTMYSFPETEVPNSCELNVDLSLNNLLQDKDVVGDKFVKSLLGDPAAEIISYAEKGNCGFIVMGTHGRKGLDRILLGSVTAEVVSKSKIPIITICDVT